MLSWPCPSYRSVPAQQICFPSQSCVCPHTASPLHPGKCLMLSSPQILPVPPPQFVATGSKLITSHGEKQDNHTAISLPCCGLSLQARTPHLPEMRERVPPIHHLLRLEDAYPGRCWGPSLCLLPVQQAERTVLWDTLLGQNLPMAHSRMQRPVLQPKGTFYPQSELAKQEPAHPSPDTFKCRMDTALPRLVPSAPASPELPPGAGA